MKSIETQGQTKREIIVKVGAEGGSLTLFGTRDKEGMWHFEIELNESALAPDDKPFEPEDFFKTTSARSWELAKKLLHRYSWYGLYPIRVHSDFRHLVWAALLDEANVTDARVVARWMENLGKWHDLCWPQGSRR